jgi:hypothetical protein
MNARRSTAARRRVGPSKGAYSSAELREFNEEIDDAVRHLHDLGKSPEDAISLLRSLTVRVEISAGWTQHQFCAAVKLAILLALRMALRDPSLTSIAGLVTIARWLGETSQQIVKRNFARKGGRRSRQQANIMDACKDIRSRSPNVKAKQAYHVLSHEGHRMLNGEVIRFRKPMALSTFQTRYWTKAKVLT